MAHKFSDSELKTALSVAIKKNWRAHRTVERLRLDSYVIPTYVILDIVDEEL